MRRIAAWGSLALSSMLTLGLGACAAPPPPAEATAPEAPPVPPPPPQTFGQTSVAPINQSRLIAGIFPDSPSVPAPPGALPAAPSVSVPAGNAARPAPAPRSMTDPVTRTAPRAAIGRQALAALPGTQVSTAPSRWRHRFASPLRQSTRYRARDTGPTSAPPPAAFPTDSAGNLQPW